MTAMNRDTLLLLAALLAIPLIFFTGVVRLQTTPETIMLWNDVEVRCDPLEASLWLLSQPNRAVLRIDTNPSRPYPPLYTGGVTRVLVNGEVVKSYNPPLLDQDEIDVTPHIKWGINGLNRFKVVFNVDMPPFCSLGTQATFTGSLEATYLPRDGGGGNDGVRWLDQNMLILILGVTLIIAAFIVWRSGRRG
jgi:hypothetical protein